MIPAITITIAIETPITISGREIGRYAAPSSADPETGKEQVSN